MKFILINDAAKHEQLLSELGQADAQSFDSKRAIIERIALYGMLIVMGFWLYVSFPNIFPEEGSVIEMLGKIIVVPILCPILYVLLRLIANPINLFRPETVVFIKLSGLSSNINVSFSRILGKFEAVLIALLPFILLSVFPFILLLSGKQLDIAIGLLASISFAMSLPNLLLALAYFLGYSKIQQFPI